MFKSFVAAAAVAVLVAGCLASSNDEVVRAPPVPPQPAAAAVEKSGSAKAAAGDIPPEIRIASAVGEVVFHHEMHFKDLGVNCVECHHQIDAKTLKTPHPEYLKASTVNCTTCHSETDKPKATAFTCSECHRTNPRNIADETLSAKVVVHKKCWKCHQVATGKEASTGCEKCHSGKKAL